MNIDCPTSHVEERGSDIGDSRLEIGGEEEVPSEQSLENAIRERGGYIFSSLAGFGDGVQAHFGGPLEAEGGRSAARSAAACGGWQLRAGGDALRLEDGCSGAD